MGVLKRLSATTAVLIAAFCAASLVAVLHWYVHANLISKIENSVRSAKMPTGLYADFQRATYSVFTGFRMHDIRMSGKLGAETVFSMHLKEMGIDYSLRFFPRIHVVISGASVYKPEIAIELPFKNHPALQTADDDKKETAIFSIEKSALAIKQLTDKIFRGKISIADDFEVQWRDASVEIAVKNINESQPFKLSSSNINGAVEIDLKNKKAGLYARGRLAPAYRKISFKLDADDDHWTGILDIDEASPDMFGTYLPAFIKRSHETQIRIKTMLKSEEGGKVSFNLDSNVKNLVFDDDSIAPRPVRLKGLEVSAKGKILPQEQKVDFSQIMLAIGKLKVGGSAAITLDESTQLEMSVELFKIPIQDIINSLPSEFIPHLKDARIAGNLGVKIGAEIDFARPRDLKLEPVVTIDEFDIISLAEGLNIDSLKKPFTHTVRIAGKKDKQIRLDKALKNFVAYEDLGENIKNAVLTCEDKGFFYHQGFLVNHIRDSLAQNLKDKKFTRGASTITMQTAKNLFLGGRKTISRKFEETLLAYAIEQRLGKKRIFEIYMNIIEWGPDIYGIAEASRYYFGKNQSELSPLEAAFLGSIISSPKRYHRMYKDGYVTDAWSTYLATILSKMGISGEEYEAARPFEPEFSWVKEKRKAAELEKNGES
jgi:hypothetical protein